MDRTCINSKSVILLPGLFAGGWIWDEVVFSLRSQGYQCVQIEQAIPVELGGSMESASSVLDKAIEECSDTPVIVGNSMGALIALEYLISNEHKVSGIVMSGSPGINEINVGVSISDLRSGEVEKARVLGNNVFHDVNKVPEKGVQEIAELFKDKRVFLNIARWLSFSRYYDVEGALSQTTRPIELLWGKNDKITPLSDWEHIPHQFNNTHMTVIDQCGHSPMLEKPDDFSIHLFDYLASKPAEHQSGAKGIAPDDSHINYSG